jgi:hypothetical protein
MITETRLINLDNKPIKVNKKTPPQSSNKDLPPLFFTSLFCGMKGMGKSYSLCKLIKFYEDSDIIDADGNKRISRIILFCPTANSVANPVFKTLKSLDEDDIHTEYSDELLSKVLEEIKDEYETINNYNNYIKAYYKYIKDYKSLNDKELSILHSFNFEKPSKLDKPPFKYPRIIFMIFDDLIGDSSAFKKNKGNILTKLVITHRHLQCNLLFTTQYIKAIPPILRANMDIFVLFKFASSKLLLEKIYPEFSGLITEDKFIELYEHAVKEPNDSLISINHSMNKQGNGFRKNWNVKLNV